MDSERQKRVAFSPMNVIAGVSTLVLFGAIAWSSLNHGPSQNSVFVRNSTSNPVAAEQSTAMPALPQGSDATSSTPLGDAILSQFASRYSSLTQNGLDADTAANVAADITPTISAQTFSESDVVTSAGTSLDAVLRYRADLRTALLPLLNNTSPELDIYARWIDTGDDSYLQKLGSIADDYQTALKNAQAVTTPSDAVHYQVGILNALSQFSVALRALANNAKDPLASITLLRTYNAAEQQMFIAFNSLGIYAAQKAATTTPAL